MEKEKKSLNLITIIFMGIVIGLVIVGLIIHCLNATKEENKIDTIANSENISENSVTTIEDMTISEEEEKTESSEFDYAKIYPDKELVFSDDFYSIEVEEDDGYSRLCLPVINLDFEEVKKINSEIEDFYNKNKVFYQNEMENASNNEVLPTLHYTSSLINGILNVIFYRFENYESSEEYYYIDIKNEKLLSNEEFLNKLGIGEKELEDLINDTILENYFYESSFEEFNKLYKNVEEFKNDIVYTNTDNEENTEKYEYDFDKICNSCNIRYYREYDNRDILIIKGICIPSIFGSCAPIDDITIDLNRKYVFSKHYGYNVYSSPESQSFYRSIEMPIINLNSADATKVNKELKEYFDNAVSIFEKNDGQITHNAVEAETVEIDGQEVTLKEEVILNEKGEIVIDKYYTINFEYLVINDKILSIIVTEGINSHAATGVEDEEENPKSLVYNFNIETGKLLTNEEFIEMCGVKIEDFKEELDKKLETASYGEEIEYDINSIKIGFYKEDTGVTRIENGLRKFVALGKNFPNYPYTWITVDLDNNK